MNRSREFNERLNAMRKQKLAVEDTAFDDCGYDMKGVEFSVGGNNASKMGAVAVIVLLLPLTVRMMMKRRLAGHPTNEVALIAAILLLSGLFMLAFIYAAKAAHVIVKEKTVSYKDKSWTFDEIDSVVCTSFNMIKVYSRGKKILSFSWNLDNAEYFIAWVKKCGIPFEDKRNIYE